MDILTPNYGYFLDDLKKRVYSARQAAVLSVNKELILLYHHIGLQVLAAQANQGWGVRVVDRLSQDLRAAFPEMKGFSVRNINYMRKFAVEYPDLEFLQQLLQKLPWFHLTVLLDRVSNKQHRLFYVEQVAVHGWSRNMLLRQIESRLHLRSGQAVTNFKERLSTEQSSLAQGLIKDPYIFDFLSIGKEAHEREMEKALVHHMERFLVELGAGFAFVGRQYHLEVGGQDFYIDLLFYHLKLRCFVVVELKDTDFKPEYTGKVNFYLSAVDDLLKQSTDQPSIGIILCRSKNNVVAEYALRDMVKPVGLAEYYLAEALSGELKSALPTIEELEDELAKSLPKE